MKKDKSAFTLVEILLALAVLGIGLVSILSIFAVGTNSVRRAVEKTEASFIAQMVFEDFKRQGHTDPSSLIVLEDDISSNYNGYSVTPTVTTNVGGIDNLSKADITVNKGGRLIASFSTYITKYEP